MNKKRQWHRGSMVAALAGLSNGVPPLQQAECGLYGSNDAPSRLRV